MREDLEAGRDAWLEEAPSKNVRKEREKTSFLKYRDAAGRVADFHALRHTYISRLVRSGVNVKVAQELARHEEPLRITSRRPEAERGGRRQGGRSRQPVSGLSMQADAACGHRSRPKPEGYPDRLSPAHVDPRPLCPRPIAGPDAGAGRAAGDRFPVPGRAGSPGHRHGGRCTSRLRSTLPTLAASRVASYCSRSLHHRADDGPLPHIFIEDERFAPSRLPRLQTKAGEKGCARITGTETANAHPQQATIAAPHGPANYIR